MDIATLGLRVDSSALRTADRDLDRFERSADEAGRSADQFGRNASAMGVSVRRAATKVAASIGGIAAANRTLQAAEQYRSITNGFLAMGQSAQEAAETVELLARISNDTRAPLEATAQLYRRVSSAADDLGASTEDIANFTETVGMALAASGTSADEASGALLQLSQAMAGGVVRAEEFNSILDGAYPIAQAAARGIDEAGGSVGRLRVLVNEGAISSEAFMQAILSQQEQIRDAFEATTPTVSQAMQVLSNNFTMLIGGADSASGATETMANAIMMVAQNLDTVIPIVAAFGALATIIVSPLLALAAAGAAAATYLVVNWSSLRERFPGITGAVESAMALMGAAFRVVQEVVVSVVSAVEAVLSGDWTAAWEAAKAAVSKVAGAITGAIPSVVNAVGAVVNAAGLALLGLVREARQMGANAVDALLEAFANLGKRIVAAIGGAVQEVFDRAEKWVQSFREVGSNMVQGLVSGLRSSEEAITAGRDLGLMTLEEIQSAVETESPSRATMRIGEYMGEGLAIGIDSMADDVAATARGMAEGILAETQAGLGDPASIGRGFVEGLLGGMGSGDIMGGLSGFLGNARSSFMDSSMMSGITSGIGSALSGAMPIIGGISTAMNLINGFSSREKIGETSQTIGHVGLGGGLYEEVREEFKKTSYWGLKTSREIKTSYRDLHDETQQVRAEFGALVNGIRDAGAPLGVVGDAFGKVKVPIVDGDIAGALERADRAIGAMIPDLAGLKREGETVAQTLGRLTGALQTYNASAVVMRLPGLPNTVAGAGQASDILGRVNLSGAESALFGMEDPGMQMRILTSRINREMRRLGLSGPLNDGDQLMTRLDRARSSGRASAAAGLASLAPLVGQRDDLRDQINREMTGAADAATSADLSRTDALRDAERAAQDAERAERDLANARDRLRRDVAGYQGFSTFREEQIAMGLAGRANEGDELKDVLENLWATMRTIAANTGRQADDTSILVAQGVV